MAKAYHNFRVQVAGDGFVRIQEWGAQDPSPQEKPARPFRKKELLDNEEIKTLLEAASQGELSDSEQVIRLGEALFEALFDEKLLDTFVESYKNHALDKNQLFRFELDIDEQAMPEVAALPWEFMCLPEKAGRGELWLATAPNIVFSRRRTLWNRAEPIQLGKDEKLRIALVISAPRGEAVVDYEPVEQALKDLIEDKGDQLELVVVNPAKFGAVDEVLKNHKPHILHFLGHGRLHNEKNEEVGQLAFVNDMGRAIWINAREFSERFTRHTPGIVVLQACEGGKLSSSKAFVGVASKVVQQNIPVVLAMQYEVTNDTAIEFVSRFYWELADGNPVDVAAQLGRRAIANGPNLHRTQDFATPVIFMRVRDGYVFQRSNIEDEPRTPKTEVSLNAEFKDFEAEDAKVVGTKAEELSGVSASARFQKFIAKGGEIIGNEIAKATRGSVTTQMDMKEGNETNIKGIQIDEV